MKGAIFNIFEDFVVEHHGEDTYDEILESCKLQTDGIFVGPGTYPDADLLEIVGKTIEKLGVPLDQALLSFGQYLFKGLHRGHPNFAESQPNLKSFLESIDGVIHIEVNKLYPDAVTPKFEYHSPDADTLEITYTSKRNLPDLVEGLILGAADHFKEKVQISRSSVDDAKSVWKFHLKFLGRT